MTANPNPTNEKHRRREAVAHLRARKLTQREIVVALMQLDPPIKTSVATVNRDLGVLRKEWAANAARSTEEWVADEIHDLEELQAAAWKAKKYQIVLNCKERIAKLRGLDKPTSTTQRTLNVDLQSLTDEQLQRLAAGEDLIHVLTSTATG